VAFVTADNDAEGLVSSKYIGEITQLTSLIRSPTESVAGSPNAASLAALGVTVTTV
jgi:hypothetical protein